MHYVIDGYNFFFCIASQINPLKQTREQFIETLNAEISFHNFDITLVFDSTRENGAPFASKKMLSSMEVVFSPQGLSADEYILEMLSCCTTPQNEVIITSDRELAKKARYLGAKTKTIEEFLQYITKKKKHSEKEIKHDQETAANMKRLQDIFEKRLKDGDG